MACSPASTHGRQPTHTPAAVATARTAHTDAPAAVSPRALPPPLPRIEDALVSAGLRWLVRFEPARLLAKLSATGLFVVEPSQLAAFEYSVGLRGSSVDAVAVAGFDYSTLYLARVAPPQAQEVNVATARFAERLAQAPVSQDVLELRLLSGIREASPQHFAQLDRVTAAWAEGDPSPLKASMLLAQRRLTVAPALRGASLSLLPPECHVGDVVVYLPGPLARDEALTAADSGVLDSVLAASTALSLREEHLHVGGCLVGDWHDTGITRVRSLLDAVLAHRFTSLLGLDETERRARVTQAGDVVQFSYQWRAKPALERARALLELDVSTLLGPTQ